MEDRRVRRTRAAIHRAFFELLQKKSYSDITVKELTDQADLTRKTFYLHYGTLDDVLREFMTEQWNAVRRTLLEDGVIRSGINVLFDYDAVNYVALFTRLNRLFEQRWPIMKRLVADDRANRVLFRQVHAYSRQLKQLYQQHYSLPEDVLSLYVTNNITGFFTMCMEWFISPEGASVEAFAETAKNIIRSERELLRKWEIRK